MAVKTFDVITQIAWCAWCHSIDFKASHKGSFSFTVASIPCVGWAWPPACLRERWQPGACWVVDSQVQCTAHPNEGMVSLYLLYLCYLPTTLLTYLPPCVHLVHSDWSCILPTVCRMEVVSCCQLQSQGAWPSSTGWSALTTWTPGSGTRWGVLVRYKAPCRQLPASDINMMKCEMNVFRNSHWPVCI